MDLNKLVQDTLNQGALENGMSNWESMKLSITESEAKFIEKMVLLAIKKVLRSQKISLF